MNGITSVAQRWTHIRNSFGLWLSFIERELCWFIDLDVPAKRPANSQWLVPSWSWASTRGGMVKHAIWQRLPMRPYLMIKPLIHTAVGTAFDMPLPLQAWQEVRFHRLELKGSLRRAIVCREKTEAGDYEFAVVISPDSRRSDHEVYKFYPDCLEEFPIDEDIIVWILPFWHFDGNNEDVKLGHHLDISLVLKSINEDHWMEYYGPHTMPLEDIENERTMRRLGLLETTYGLDEERDLDAIQEEWWFKYVKLV
jgi:hypothetical protein